MANLKENLRESRWGIVIPSGIALLLVTLAGTIEFDLPIPNIKTYLLFASVLLGFVLATVENRWLFLLCGALLPITVFPQENTIFEEVSLLPLAGILIASILIRRDHRAIKRQQPVLHIFLYGLYILVSYISFFGTGPFFNSFIYTNTDCLLLFAPFLAFIRLNNPGQFLRQTMIALAIGAALALLYSLFFSPWSNKYASFPFFDNTNYFSALLGILLPFLVAVALSKRGLWRILWGTAAGIFLVSILVMQSRGAWMGLAGGTILGLLFFLKSKPQKWALVAIALSGAAALFLTQPSESPINPETTLEKIRSIPDTEHTFSNRERMVRWKVAMRIFAKHPVLGCGPASYSHELKFHLDDNEEVNAISYWAGWTGQAHSEYLTRLSERGMFVFLAFLAIILLAIFNLHRLQKKQIWGRTWTSLTAASLGTWLAHGLVDDLSTANAVWFAIGCIFAATAAAIRPKPETQVTYQSSRSKKMKPKYMANPNPQENFSP